MFKKKLVRQIHHNPDCSIFSKLPSIYVILGKCRVWYLFGSQLSHLFVSASHYLEKQPTLLKYPFKWGYLQTYRKRPPVGRKRLPDVRQRSPRSPTRLKRAGKISAILTAGCITMSYLLSQCSQQAGQRGTAGRAGRPTAYSKQIDQPSLSLL